MARKGEGKASAWLHDHADDEDGDCLIWPFCRDGYNGYGRVGFNGTSYWAHRFMCELVNGPAPTPDHEASHSCGKGHDACVHPKHLLWKTKTANQLDRRQHGTKANGGWRHKPKLTPADVIAIRQYAGPLTQLQLAETYGVTDATVRDVRSGKSWKWLISPETQSRP